MKNSETILVHAVQTLGTLDGPGVRFVIFLKGCPLRCRYCHNPDTWNVGGGQEYTWQQLAGLVMRYRHYINETGGVTVSGGEPLLQAERLIPFFTEMRKRGVHTALDTSGCLWSESARLLLEQVDLCLLDVKHMNGESYRLLTGGGRLEDTLFFLEMLDRMHIDTWIRQVVAEGLNDTPEELSALKNLIRHYSCVKKTELLGFSTMCKTKYEALGIDFPMADTPDTDTGKRMALQKYFDEMDY